MVRSWFTVSLVLAVVTAGLLVSLRTASADSTFKPSTSVKLCNGLPASGFGDGSVSGNPACADVTNDGVTLTNTLPSGDVYYSSQVTFVPSGGTPAVGSAGTLAGGVRSAISVGSFNAPCNISVDEDFVLYNVALPDNVGDPRSSTNIAYPMAVATPDRFSKWKVGSAPTGADPSGIDTGGDPDYAVGTSFAFQNYPSYLLDTFDADGVGGAPPLYPQAVYGAVTNFGGQWRPLFLVKLAPSSMPSYSPAFPAGGGARAAMGSAVVWVLGDPTDGTPTPDNISDICAPATTTITLTGSTSMATGTNFYLEYLSSERDLDQDGYENAIDTCPLNVNVGNPRIGTGDADADGIDDTCDPAMPTPAAAGDFDGDGFVNRDDNCALVSNPGQAEGDTGFPFDGGPAADNIGDNCDSEGGTVTFVQNCGAQMPAGVTPTPTPGPCPTPSWTSITMSDTVANGRYMTVTNVIAKCIGGTDADGDGYCLAQDNADSGGCATQAPPSCTSRHTQWPGATHPALQMDSDGDLRAGGPNTSDAIETYVGTDPAKSCSANPTNNNEPMDNFLLDLNDNQAFTGQDTGSFGGINGAYNHNVIEGPFGTSLLRPGVRFDFNADGVINGQDTGKYGVSWFSTSCMLKGVPAFSQQ